MKAKTTKNHSMDLYTALRCRASVGRRIRNLHSWRNPLVEAGIFEVEITEARSALRKIERRIDGARVIID